MPCIFCIAVFAVVAGALATAAIDQIEEKLRGAGHDVTRTSDTESVARFDLNVSVAGRRDPVPVVVTVYKQHNRVRIQVMTHDISREQAEKIEDDLAKTLDAKIVDRSDAHGEEKVREAVQEAGQPQRHASGDKTAAPAAPPASPTPPKPQAR